MYKLIKALLFKLDPETAHHLALRLGKITNATGLISLIKKIYDVQENKVEVLGLNFKNPIGLAAGFDKDCEIYPLLEALGFSHIEVGTVTPKPQSGNPRPRIFRYAEEQALINRMGFPSKGLEHLKKQIESLGERSSVLGINIGKNKDTPIEKAKDDYIRCFQELEHLGDYFAVNVSSPNTPDLRKLQEKDLLQDLFLSLKSVSKLNKPILIKIAPDLSEGELDEIIEVALDCKCSGLILTNTTISRETLKTKTDEAGGLSGKPLKDLSLKVLQSVVQKTAGQIPLISVGGIFNREDLIERLNNGASLVQVYTGLIYEGPGIVKLLS